MMSGPQICGVKDGLSLTGMVKINVSDVARSYPFTQQIVPICLSVNEISV